MTGVNSDQLREDIAACRESHRLLHRRLADISGEVLLRPSRLPQWTVGHVVTHLARNADSVVRRLTAAEDGNVVTQYVGGPAGRAAEIETGASRPAAEMLADLVRADAAVDSLFSAADDQLWLRPVAAGGSSTVPAWTLVFRRWREVEVHHADLGLGYEWTDWPDRLVQRWVPSLLSRLADRADPRALAAWATGRAPAPTLPPWG